MCVPNDPFDQKKYDCAFGAVVCPLKTDAHCTWNDRLTDEEHTNIAAIVAL